MNEVSEDCKNCVFFRLHGTFEYLGYCVKSGELLVLSGERKPCSNFKKVTFEDLENIISSGGSLYCITCGVYIHTVEELKSHLEKHIVVGSFSDMVASEEAPIAD